MFKVMVQGILTGKYVVLRLLPYNKLHSALKQYEYGGSFIKILCPGPTFHPLPLFLFPPSEPHSPNFSFSTTTSTKEGLLSFDDLKKDVKSVLNHH